MILEEDSDLSTFVHRWAAAIAANDVELMSTFVTDDWLLIDVGGQVTAETFHELVRTGALCHDTMVHEVTAIRRLSEDVAVILTHCVNSGSFEGMPLAADEWTSDTVVRTDGRWRCVLTQLTPRRRTVTEALQ